MIMTTVVVGDASLRRRHQRPSSRFVADRAGRECGSLVDGTFLVPATRSVISCGLVRFSGLWHWFLLHIDRDS